MFNIVFGCNESYVKYLSVLITSIMKNIDKQKNFLDVYNDVNLSPKIDINSSIFKEVEGFVFHILIDNIQEATSIKLKQMIEQLSEECDYHAELRLHIMDTELFKKMDVPIWVKHYATYFRLCLGSILPENCEKCLYLDVDMLVFSDLRELFCLDLKDNVIAASPDIKQWPGSSFVGKSKNKNFKDLVIDKGPLYFNAGFMIINLKQWRMDLLEKKMLDVALSYTFDVGDQDILNYAVNKKVVMLPCKWNFIAGHFILDRKGVFNNFKGESEQPYWYYTRKEMEKNLKDLSIIHYTHYVVKPWESYYTELDMNYYPVHYSYYDEWWYMALKTPIFNNELIELHKTLKSQELKIYSKTLAFVLNYRHGSIASVRIKNHLSYKIGNLVLKTIGFGKILKFPFLLVSVLFHHYMGGIISKILFDSIPYLKPLPLDCCADYVEALKIKNHLSYKYGEIILYCCRYWYKGKIFIIPYMLLKEYKKFKNIKR
ncbi:glycosyltransferase family 8 protein [Campylobacter insulaenigrae]|uniref:glycosyltransferase family 8 protein n=1 Tax=Campylobacter insulaenigrae TaxID=260714 RepID=UPI002152765A|nr:glycosyltransferase family 8 protein [Campylobacter insulaenigrae]MCR6574035.1 glycosyltransferase family 8 protein [Campylobacter insulaenigrae]MCR6580341.1 glycosyltransferase family 8 protein [Campylobacter insulaenigrae]MCR6586453.1 glycosyltransferase family 8 protein [Campylobacter insulaenigrae]